MCSPSTHFFIVLCTKVTVAPEALVLRRSFLIHKKAHFGISKIFSVYFIFVISREFTVVGMAKTTFLGYNIKVTFLQFRGFCMISKNERWRFLWSNLGSCKIIHFTLRKTYAHTFPLFKNLKDYRLFG